MVWSPPSGYAPDKVKRGADSESHISATHTYIVRMGLSVTVWAQIKSRANSAALGDLLYISEKRKKRKMNFRFFSKSEKLIFDFFIFVK